MSAAIEVYADQTYLDAAGNVKKLAPNYTSADGEHLSFRYAIIAKGTESDGTIYRVFKDMPPNFIPTSIRIAGDALTGCTSVGVGLYKSGLGSAAVSASCFAAALDIHAGAASLLSGTAFNGLSAATPATLMKRLFEYAGHTVANKLGAYDLCLTLNTGGTATGNIIVVVEGFNG